MGEQPNYLTINEVAERLDLSRQRVHQIVREGQLQPVFVRHGAHRATVLLFDPVDVEKLRVLRSEHPTRLGPYRWILALKESKGE